MGEPPLIHRGVKPQAAPGGQGATGVHRCEHVQGMPGLQEWIFILRGERTCRAQ